MRWRTWWVVGWLWAALCLAFVGHARADQNFSAIHVCVRPPNVPATVGAWVFTGNADSYVVRLPPKEFKKQAGDLPIYVYDPFAPPESVKLYPMKYNQLVCPPPPEKPKPPEEEKKEEKDKKAAASPGAPRGPPPEDPTKRDAAPDRSYCLFRAFEAGTAPGALALEGRLVVVELRRDGDADLGGRYTLKRWKVPRGRTGTNKTIDSRNA